MVIEPEPLTVAVVEFDVGDETLMLPFVSHCLNLYPVGIFPVESEYGSAVTLVEPPCEWLEPAKTRVAPLTAFPASL
jgi:hypothetical protein